MIEKLQFSISQLPIVFRALFLINSVIYPFDLNGETKYYKPNNLIATEVPRG